MRASTVLLALAGSASATKEFTRMVFPQGLVARNNDTETGYKPEVTSCGTGTTCAEACGAGYEMCSSIDKKAHCYNPAAGETCCAYAGVGTSCDTGYFCAHASSNTTNSVCCSSDTSLEQCAVKNNIASGALASDPAVTTTSSSTSIPLTTSVHASTTNSTTIHLSTAVYLAETASAGWASSSANATSYWYSASAEPTTTADIADATATATATAAGSSDEDASSAGAAATTKSKTSSSSSSNSVAAPIAALALVAGAFATFF